MRAIAFLLAGFLLITIPQLRAKTAGDSDQPARDAEARAALLSTPRPDYPIEARRHFYEGRGVYRLRFDMETGRVTEVTVIESTGHTILDQASTRTFLRWRIKPHSFKAINVPVNFRMSGEESAVWRALRGKLLSAPPLHYPLEAAAHGVTGAGRFQLTIDPRTGLVTAVQILQSTSDRRLDDAAAEMPAPMALQTPHPGEAGHADRLWSLR